MPHPGDCHHWVIPVWVEGEPVQAVASNRDKPAQAEPACQELENPPASFLFGTFLCLQRCKQLSLINLSPPCQAVKRFYLHRAGGRSRV